MKIERLQSLVFNLQDQANPDYLNALRHYRKYDYNLRQLTLYNLENRRALSQDFDEIFDIK